MGRRIHFLSTILMKHYITIYYLLFVLLIMGSFAAMAQNDYGITILGLASITFSVLFAAQLIPIIRRRAAWDWWNFFELISLAMLALLLGFRVFYIHFALVEFVFGTFGALLALVFIRKLFHTFRELKLSSRWLSYLILPFHLSIILYIISMVSVPFIPGLSEPAGVIGFILLLVFVLGSYLKKDIVLNGEKTSGFAF